jgi:cell division protein ZapD
MTSSVAPEAGPAATAAAEILVFEQPLNERMRTFMRLDFLYNQALYPGAVGPRW